LPWAKDWQLIEGAFLLLDKSLNYYVFAHIGSFYAAGITVTLD